MSDLFGKINSKWLIPLCTAIVAIVFIVLGVTKFGFWHEVKGPMPGFVPIIVASLLLFSSVLAFVFSFKEKSAYLPKENTLVMLGGLCIFIATYIVGLIPAAALYVIFWLRVVEKTPWKQTFIVLAVIMSIAVGVFVLWLDVPFPNGIIIDELFG